MQVTEAVSSVSNLLLPDPNGYGPNPGSRGGIDYHVSADLTGQANHLGVTIGADIVKQTLPENTGGYKALNMGDSS